MQSKPSKNRNGRSANQAEKNFQRWMKDQPCCWCGSESGSIVDHVVGAKTGHNKVHIGHWFVLPNCEICDDKKTRLGQKLGNYSVKWHILMNAYESEIHKGITPMDVVLSIVDWGNGWRNGS